jgi:putative ATP-binding cassette transporter
MKTIFFLMRYSRRFLVLAIIAGAVSGAANTGLLAIINAALNGDRSRKAALAMAFVALCAVLPLTRMASELLLMRLGQGALLKLRMDLSREILSVPLRRLEEIGAHRLLAALTDDVPSITNVVTFIPVLCINAAVAASCLIYMGWLSWVMLLAVIGIIVLGIISYQLSVTRSFRHLRLARKEGDTLYKNFRALTSGIKELKIHRKRRKAFLTDVLYATAARARRHNLSGLTIYTLAASWGQLLAFVVIGLLIFVLSDLVSMDEKSLTGFSIVILYLMAPLQVIMNSLPTLGRANVALKNVEELGLRLKADASEAEKDYPERENPAWKSIEFVGVVHNYRREDEDSNFVLGPINLALSPGEIVFIIGGNGSGKTTLAKLLVGLYAPESGEIRLNGVPLTEEMKIYYRDYFSVVFSDFYIFDSLLGIETPGLDDKARIYLSQLQLSHKVKINNGALSTTELSQGQRKRLALLTGYLEDRPIYLFDEWAADQDPVFKEIFYYQLLPELKARGKTVLVISHDDRYYHVGDRIIKLDYGKIVYDEPVSYLANATSEVPLSAGS